MDTTYFNVDITTLCFPSPFCYLPLTATSPESHATTNGTSGDLEAVKQEILREMRKEIAKAKQEIIDGEKS